MGCAAGAEPHVIAAAVRTLSLLVHPDKNAGNTHAATEAMQLVNAAGERLQQQAGARRAAIATAASACGAEDDDDEADGSHDEEATRKAMERKLSGVLEGSVAWWAIHVQPGKPVGHWVYKARIAVDEAQKDAIAAIEDARRSRDFSKACAKLLFARAAAASSVTR